MSRHLSSVLAALAIFVVLGVIYVMNFGLYPRYFDLEWDEEVRLHDGQVVLMHVKQTYERIGHRLHRFEDAIFRKNEFRFDAGPDHGRITFTSRLGIRSIDRVQGNWYVVLYGQGPYGNHPDEMPDRWGMDFTVNEERLAKLEGSLFRPISWNDLPADAIRTPNLVLGSMPIDVLFQFQEKRMSLEDKKRLREKYPPSPDASKISRPIRMKSKATK
jgi:hypothetical protein